MWSRRRIESYVLVASACVVLLGGGGARSGGGYDRSGGESRASQPAAHDDVSEPLTDDDIPF